jgi:hypothetical protein
VPAAYSVPVFGERFELCQRNEVLGLGRECGIDSDQGVGLKLGEGQVLRVVCGVPVLLARDPPGSAARYSVPEQPHLQLGESFMVLKCHVFGELAAPDGLEKQRKRLGADEVWGDDLMPGADLDTRGDHVQQGGGVDHVAGQAGHPRQVFQRPPGEVGVCPRYGRH